MVIQKRDPDMDRKEKEAKLAQAYVDSNGTNIEAFDELCRSIRPICNKLMGKYKGKIPYLDAEDYVLIGQIVLWKVLERMRKNPDQDINFRPYLFKAIANRYASEFRNYVLSNPVQVRAYENARDPLQTIAYFDDYEWYKNKILEQKRAKDKRYYEKHKERILKAREQYAREHREQRHEITRRYYWKHREEIREKERQKYHEKHEEKLEYFRKYRAEHRELYRESAKRYREKRKKKEKSGG